MIPAEIRRWLTLACVVVALIFVGLTLAWCVERAKARQAAGEARVETSQANLGEDAGKRADAVREAEKANQDQTRANTDFITGADNANEDAGEAGRRGWIAYCRRERMRGNDLSAFCTQLLGADPK